MWKGRRAEGRQRTVPVLQVSFISRHRSLTEEALLPSAAPIVAQSLPCFIRSLKQESANQHLVQLFLPFNFIIYSSFFFFPFDWFGSGGQQYFESQSLKVWPFFGVHSCLWVKKNRQQLPFSWVREEISNLDMCSKDQISPQVTDTISQAIPRFFPFEYS